MRAVAIGALTALWVVVGSHCLLEEVSALSFLKCGGDADPASHCEDAACLTLESGHYVAATQAKAPGAVRGMLVLDLSVFDLMPQASTVRGEVVGGAPPDLPKVWQFSFRAALPPRAPSIAS